VEFLAAGKVVVLAFAGHRRSLALLPRFPRIIETAVRRQLPVVRLWQQFDGKPADASRKSQCFKGPQTDISRGGCKLKL
jgi:hypothetical protein